MANKISLGLKQKEMIRISLFPDILATLHMLTIVLKSSTRTAREGAYLTIGLKFQVFWMQHAHSTICLFLFTLFFVPVPVWKILGQPLERTHGVTWLTGFDLIGTVANDIFSSSNSIYLSLCVVSFRASKVHMYIFRTKWRLHTEQCDWMALITRTRKT